MLNKIILGGRICNDIDVKTTQSGVAVAQFRVACDRPFTNNGERKTDFIPVVAWRNTAEFLGKFFHKGSRIIVEGSLQSREYQDKEGNKRVQYEAVAEQVHFVDPKSSSPENSATFSDPQEQPKQEAFNVLTIEEDLPF